MVKSVHKFGATLDIDKWSSIINHPLFNAMLVSPTTKQFLEVVDTTGYPKTAEYQASIMEKYKEEVDPQKVVQICTDNASSMKAAADIVTDKYPHIYFLGCIVHVMNLLLEDWVGEDNVDERSGEEVEDNHQVHKETAHAANHFPQARGEVELIDVVEYLIWIELPNGEPVTTC